MTEELYNGVPFCDLSEFDKEKVNQGILEADEVEHEENENDHRNSDS
jgi:hypothetical protein